MKFFGFELNTSTFDTGKNFEVMFDSRANYGFSQREFEANHEACPTYSSILSHQF